MKSQRKFYTHQSNNKILTEVKENKIVENFLNFWMYFHLNAFKTQ